MSYYITLHLYCSLPLPPLTTETMAFSKTSKDISLDGTLLRAQCIDAHSEYQDSEIDLNQYIANVNGTLKWKSNGNFVKSSKKITVEGSVLKCKTRNKFHQWHQTELDLDEKIANCNGRLVYGFQRAIIAVNEHNVEEVTQYIKGVYEANKDEVFTQVAEGTDHKVRRHGPLARYVKLWVAHVPGMPGTFSPPLRVSDPDMNHGTCLTHVPWFMLGSLTNGFLWSRWQGKRSRLSWRMHNPQFYVSGKGPIENTNKINTSRYRQNGFHFADDVLKCTSFGAKHHISNNIWLICLPEGPSNSKTILKTY